MKDGPSAGQHYQELGFLAMHYFFFDETYRDMAGEKTIVVSSWAAEQGKVSNRLGTLNELWQKRSTLKQIDSALESLDALALVAWATLDKSLFRAGERDSTDDITDMARPNTVWSVSVGFALASLIGHLTLMRRHINTVDVYFDPKSLKSDHATALEGFLRKDLAKEAKRFGSQLGGILKDLNIRRIQAVQKPRKNDAPTKFQLGTSVSHWLCSKSDKIRETAGTSRIKAHDMSDEVKRTVQQFDGKSFYDS